jgi:thiamine biosynthesis lipoprotein
MEAAGYDRSFEYVVERSDFRWSAPDAHADTLHVQRRRTASYVDVHLDRVAGTARKPVGLRLDLGGMGKGWTVDRAAELLMGEGPFLVNAGGDLYADGQPGNVRGWAVTIEHPLAHNRWVARLHFTHAALATSTTMKRRWSHGGRLHHHLLDPRTGRPTETDAISVSVLAQRAVLAEVLAKVALLLGVEAGLEYLTQTEGVEGLIVSAQGHVLTTPGLASYLDAIEPAGIDCEGAANQGAARNHRRINMELTK